MIVTITDKVSEGLPSYRDSLRLAKQAFDAKPEDRAEFGNVQSLADHTRELVQEQGEYFVYIRSSTGELLAYAVLFCGVSAHSTGTVVYPLVFSALEKGYGKVLWDNIVEYLDRFNIAKYVVRVKRTGRGTYSERYYKVKGD